MARRLIITAKAANSDYYALIDVDEDDNDIDPYTPDRVLRAYHALKKPSWTIEPIDRNVICVCRYFYPDRDRSIFVSLSAEGEVGFIGREEGFYEKIPHAGLYADDAAGHGYMTRIRQIGTDLYACGLGGQVYRRVGKGRWENMDAGLLQPLSSDEVLMLGDINGPSYDRIYTVANDGLVFLFDGARWNKISVPTNVWLHAIYVEDAEHIWICGSNGTLLRGSADRGFDDVSRVYDNATFLSIAGYKGKIYLGSNVGIFIYDGTTIEPIATGLRPDLHDGHLVDAVDGVLWSFGYTDIARFDGSEWRRYPTNKA